MATLHENPRKKLATYGKASRRRVAPINSEYSSAFFGNSSQSQTPELDPGEASGSSGASIPIAESKSTRQPEVIRPKVEPQIAKQSATKSIFDVPDDDLPTPKATRPLVRPIARAKTTPNLKTTIHNFPSSGEENSEGVEKMNRNTVKTSIPTTRTLSSPRLKEPIKPTASVSNQRKTPHLFPQNGSASKALQSTSKQLPKPAPTAVTTTKNIAPPLKRASSAVTTRPKSQTQRSFREQPSLKSNNLVHNADQGSNQNSHNPSPHLSDVDMMEVDPESAFISPKGIKLWKDLLDPEDEAAISANRAEKRGFSPGKKSPLSNTNVLVKPAGVKKPAHKSTPNTARKRLIDFLAEQESSDDSEDESDFSGNQMEGVESSSDSRRSLSRAPSLAPEVVQVSNSANQASQTSGPKFVYGRERTILAEQDFMQALHIEMPTESSQAPAGRRTRRGSIPTLPALPSFHDADLEEDEGNTATMKNVHELRQAGVNNRFLDELDDFIERIGSPGGNQISMRRSGLLDLANKLKDKTFARQFRSNGAEEKLFVHLGKETDAIAGFVLVSVLMGIFAEGNVAHIIPQLRRQGVTRLLIRLLEYQQSVLLIGKERKSNMSKIAQTLLAEYHDYVLQLPVWEELKPQVLSPRTIALKCLEKMVRHTREAGNPGDIFSKELTSNLFEVLKIAPEEAAWDLPQGKIAIDFFLALSALESHSITAKTANNEDIWIGEFLPVIAETLQVALSQSSFGAAQPLILRLALNVTNNNPKAADIFARPALLAVMGQVVVTRFKMLTRFLQEEEFFMVLDYLVLTLGVMINFAEWSHPAREALQGMEGRSDDPLDRMAQLFLDNREKMAEADSVEDSQKNVAFGYLSVLLGYLALHPTIARRIQKRVPRGSLQPVVSSIEEFIVHHKTVDEIIAADPDGHSPHSGLTERLESLVAQLRYLV